MNILLLKLSKESQFIKNKKGTIWQVYIEVAKRILGEILKNYYSRKKEKLNYKNKKNGLKKEKKRVFKKA
jgi:hypothetical protein